MDVSERGFRAVYTARSKEGRGRGSKIRRAEACQYRKSCSSRIAALIQNNRSLFPLRCFTIVVRETFRCSGSIEKLEESLVNYDERFQGPLWSDRTIQTLAKRRLLSWYGDVAC